MASINRDTPFLVMVVSSSLVISSKVKPYWKPEQPPPCTNTRNFKSGLPSSAISSATLDAALSVKTKGAGISVWIFSATALMGDSNIQGSSRLYWQIVQQINQPQRPYVLAINVNCKYSLAISIK